MHKREEFIAPLLFFLCILGVPFVDFQVPTRTYRDHRSRGKLNMSLQRQSLCIALELCKIWARGNFSEEEIFMPQLHR